MNRVDGVLLSLGEFPNRQSVKIKFFRRNKTIKEYTYRNKYTYRRIENTLHTSSVFKPTLLIGDGLLLILYIRSE